MARIHKHIVLRISSEELERRRAHGGETYTTSEVQDHLEKLRHSKMPRSEEFRVEWLPQARNDLETIWRSTNPPPPPDRQNAAMIKLIKEAVNVIDRELRAWATLSTSQGGEGRVLVNGPLVVLFRVITDRSVVRVEHVERAG